MDEPFRRDPVAELAAGDSGALGRRLAARLRGVRQTIHPYAGDRAGPGEGQRDRPVLREGLAVGDPHRLVIDTRRVKPERMSLPASMEPDTVDLDLARRLLALPRIVGRHPGTGQPIRAGIGRYGPWLRHEDT